MGRLIPRFASLTSNKSWLEPGVSGWIKRDTNALEVSFSQDDTGIQVVLAGGTATNFPTDALSYYTPLIDDNGNILTADDLFDCKIVVEVLTEPSAASDVYCVVGLCQDANVNRGGYAGFHWDAAGGPELRAGNHSGNTDTSQDASQVKFVNDYLVLGGDIRQVNIQSYSSADAPLQDTARSASSATSGIYMHLTFGRSTATVGNEAIKIRFHRTEIRKIDPLP